MIDLEAGREGTKICPYCQDSTTSLIPIESGLRLRLRESAAISPIPETVCEGCHRLLMKMVSKGAALRAEQKAKEHNRIMLWRNRVGLVKHAKSLLAQKAYADAAVTYEKYLRVLEIVYEAKAGELSPTLFKSPSGRQEMTVIATVYWDLMRIYDSSERYADRQLKAAEKLAEFIRYTPVFPQIIRKAESQTRTAKNPRAFQHFLKASHASRPRCFIATAAFDGQRSDVVERLCRFRDESLKASRFGRGLVCIYYRISPSIADFLDRHPGLKPATRKVLSLLSRTRLVTPPEKKALE